MAKFRIECDGNRTKIWIGNEEISKTVEKIVFEQREDRGCRAVVSLPIRTPGQVELRTPSMGWDPAGGFSDLLVELASVLPSP